MLMMRASGGSASTQLMLVMRAVAGPALEDTPR